VGAIFLFFVKTAASVYTITMTQVDLDDTIFAEYEDQGMPIMEANNNSASFSSSQRQFSYPPALESIGDLHVVTMTKSTPNGNLATKTTTMKKKKTTPQVPEMNPKFKDLEETGKWGQISRGEILCVGFSVVLLLVGVAVAVVLFLGPGGKHAKKTTTVVAPPSPVAQEQVFYYSPEAHYKGLIGVLEERPLASTIVASLPTTADGLTGGEDPYVQAAFWLINDDPLSYKSESDLLPRFALAATYFNNGGQNWTKSENWLEGALVCDWHGILCQSNRIVEVDLSSDGLTGNLHDAWLLLDACTSIVLTDNALTGPIPGDVFGNMVSLTSLKLQNNQLTGTVPVTLLTIGTLGTSLSPSKCCVFFYGPFLTILTVLGTFAQIL
jgi:hypothetical protein